MSDKPEITPGRNARLAIVSSLEDEVAHLQSALAAARAEAEELRSRFAGAAVGEPIDEEVVADGGFLLLSTKHSPWGDRCVWWGPKCRGYTARLDAAGVYSKEDADEIARHHGSSVVVVVPVKTARAFSERSVMFERYHEGQLSHDEDEREPA